jgi:3-hydroxyisobutyrate dehydrogenase
MKALNNYVSAAGLAAACEAVLIGQQFGMDGQTIVDVLNVSTGKNNSTEHKLAQYILSATFNSGFSLGLMHKDLRAALDVALDLELRLPRIDAVTKIWGEAERQLGPKADHTEIARYLTPVP